MKTPGILLQATIIYCSYSMNSLCQEAASTGTMAMSITPSSHSSIMLPSSTTTKSQLMATSTPSPLNIATTVSTASPYKQWVIILGMTNGLFLVTTILFCTFLLVLGCLRLKAIMKENEPKREDCDTTPHWVDAVYNQKVESPTESLHATYLPMCTVETFTNPDIATLNAATLNTAALDTATLNTATLNTATLDTAITTAPNSNPPTSVPSVFPSQTRPIARKVAPPPPKKKSKKVADTKEYEIPTPTTNWFSRKKKSTKSAYKELDLSKLQSPSLYSKPISTVESA